MLRLTVAILAVCSVFYHGAESCSSKESDIKSKPFQGYSGAFDKGSFDHHQKPCSRDDANMVRCANGGKCYTMKLHKGKKDIGCRCTTEWAGERCELAYKDLGYFSDKDAQQSDHPLGNYVEYKVAGMAVGGMLVVQFIVVGILVMVRRRSQQKDNEDQEKVPVTSQPQ